MPILETAIAVTLICASTKRSRFDDKLEQVFVAGKVIEVQSATGKSLEAVIARDIEGLAGVLSVDVTRTGDRFDVRVLMRDLEFSRFKAVVDKEVALYDQYQSLTFNFDIVTRDSEEDAPSVFHAA